VEIVKQSRHSPEINCLDLGVWSIIKAAIDHQSITIPNSRISNTDHVESAMWSAAQVAWRDHMTPRKLFNIVEQRRAILTAISEVEGRAVLKESHSGIRARFNTFEEGRTGKRTKREAVE
jgi:hypothetical protein